MSASELQDRRTAASGSAIRVAGTRRGGSPVPAILAGLTTGIVVAIVLLLGVTVDGSEGTVTGSMLLAFGLGWGLIGVLSTGRSDQPQRWTAVPALLLGGTGAAMIVFQPGPATMDTLGWVWPALLAALACWMLVQVRRHLRGRGRWLVIAPIVALLACAVGGAVTTVGGSLGADAASSAPASSGELVDVGGRRLYLDCAGSGSPTVVLQAGLGEASQSWARIAPAVAATTRVCAYDRAGHGRSDEAGPQDGIVIASDLHALLDTAGEAGPFVLVGHSSGGPYVRVFAQRYPEAVAGMVLLDAQPADAFTALPDYPAFYETYRRVVALSPSLARIGVLGPLLGLSADQSTPAAARGARDEVRQLPTALQQAQAFGTLGDRPLAVVSAGSGQQAGWLAAQDALVRLASNTTHRTLDAATHTSVISGADAPASVEAILAVVDALRTGTALQ